MPSLIKNIIHLNCPRCGNGKLFCEPNPYRLKRLFEMNRYCKYCNLDLENEPGFYFGAMYVSYAISVGIILLNECWMFPIWKWNIWPQVIINAAIILGLFPYLIRYSRAIYLAIIYKVVKK